MPASNQPNILFLFPDQWRGDALSCAGNPLAETPFLDQLAAQGTRFTHAYTNAPTCIPARACLITGQTPDAVGRLGYKDFQPWPYRNTLMRCLREGGYQTMLAGKTHFHPSRIHLGFEQMALYDNQRLTPDFRSDYDLWLEERTGGLIRDTAQELDSNSQIVVPWSHEEALHASAWTVTAGIEMLMRRDPTRPFFLNLCFHRPHPPYDPPQAWFARYADKALPEIPAGSWAAEFAHETACVNPSSGLLPRDRLDRARRGYYAQIEFLDFQIGRILRYLHLHGLLNNTLVIFSSDHGEMLGDHHQFRKSSPLEGSAHVPLFVRLPADKNAPAGLLAPQPVALHDIMPTLLEAAGIEIPSEVQGRSVLPLVRGEAVTDWRTHVHCEHAHGFLPGGWQCVTDGRRKYIWGVTEGREFFFDLEKDPQELENLIHSPEDQDEISLWRKRLIGEIRHRAADRMTDGTNLTSAQQLPACRDWLEQAKT